MVFREQIVDELRTNLYRGIVLMFIWGQLDWKRPKKYCPGDKTTTCFYRFLSMSERTVVNNLEETRILIGQDRVEELFKGYSKTPKFSGKYKLEGVDYAYFTKIFFFLGQIDEKVKVKPLILDKWTRTAFCALIYEIEGPEFVKKFYRVSKNKDGVFVGVDLKGNVEIKAELYRLYNQYMHEWSVQLRVRSDKLEQFIFGWNKKKGEQTSNPRHVFEGKCMEIFTN